MTNDLAAIVGSEACAIADHVRLGLQTEKAPNYRGLSDVLLRLRCRRLVEAFVEAMRGDPDPFVSYVKSIAAERIAEGVGLEELQRALTLLEARAWITVSGRAPIADLLHHLQVVTGTIGTAKDALARAWLAGTTPAPHAQALEVSALFAGTAAGPEVPVR